jgi:WD40 repeat protein
MQTVTFILHHDYDGHAHNLSSLYSFLKQLLSNKRKKWSGRVIIQQPTKTMLWNVFSCRICHEWPPIFKITQLHDGTIITNTKNTTDLCMWDKNSFSLKQTLKIKHDDFEEYKVTVIDDHLLAICCGAGGAVKIWDIQSQRVNNSISLGDWYLVAMAYAGQRKLVTSDASVRMWDIDTGDLIWENKIFNVGKLVVLENTIVCRDEQRNIQILSVSDGTTLKTLDNRVLKIIGIHNNCFCAGYKGKFQIFDENGNLLRTIPNNNGEIVRVREVEHGTLFVVNSQYSAHLVDMNTGYSHQVNMPSEILSYEDNNRFVIFK